MSTAAESTRTQPVPDDVGRCVRAIASAAQDELVAVIFFGSRLLRTSPDRHSAADLFVVVEDYGPFYARLARAGLVRGRPRWFAILNHWLPPNVLSISPGGQPGCKCFVIGRRHFARAMSSRARDHFCRGRLVQTTALIHVRDEIVDNQVRDRLRQARVEALRWVPDRLEERFTVEDFCLAMLRTSFAAEIRPEPAGRVREVFDAQRDRLGADFEVLLHEVGPRFGITADGAGFRRGKRRPWWSRARQRLWFAHSRVRATLRWAKYVQTFEDWLDYVVHKVHRRTGVRVELTDAERRWPLLLLWPKAVRVLAAGRRDRGGTRSKGSRP